MAHPGTPDHVLLHTLEVLKRHDNNQVQTAKALGINRETLRWRILVAKKKIQEGTIKTPKPFDIPILPDGSPDPEALIERRKEDFERTRSAKVARKLIAIPVKIDGPIGIVHFGDPHVDDDGTDIEALERHMITEALDRHGGNISRVAEALGLSRAALYRRFEKFGIKS